MRFELGTKSSEITDFAQCDMTTYKDIVNFYLKIKNLKNGIKKVKRAKQNKYLN